MAEIKLIAYGYPSNAVTYLIFVPSYERNIISDQRMLRNMCVDFSELKPEATNFYLVVCPTSAARLTVFYS